jgi:hypothetical protein
MGEVLDPMVRAALFEGQPFFFLHFRISHPVLLPPLFLASANRKLEIIVVCK